MTGSVWLQDLEKGISPGTSFLVRAFNLLVSHSCSYSRQTRSIGHALEMQKDWSFPIFGKGRRRCPIRACSLERLSVIVNRQKEHESLLSYWICSMEMELKSSQSDSLRRKSDSICSIAKGLGQKVPYKRDMPLELQLDASSLTSDSIARLIHAETIDDFMPS